MAGNTGAFFDHAGTMAEMAKPGDRAPTAGVFCAYCVLVEENAEASFPGKFWGAATGDDGVSVDVGDKAPEGGMFCPDAEVVHQDMTGDCIWIENGDRVTGEGFAITPAYAGPVTRDMLEESDTAETFGYFCPACIGVPEGAEAPLPGSFYSAESFPDHLAVEKGREAPDDGLFCPGGTGNVFCDPGDCTATCADGPAPTTCKAIATMLAEGGCAASCPDCLLDHVHMEDGTECPRAELETMIKEAETTETTTVVVKSPAPLVSMAWTTLIALVFAAAALI
jgi:hypothetical protein